MNSIVFTGRLTADIETRAAGEHQLHRFTVAINQGERTTFVPTELWNKPHLEKYLHKGSRVLVRGALKQDNWETENGDKRSRLFVTGHEVEFIDAVQSQDREGDGRGESRQRSHPPSRSPNQNRRAPQGQRAVEEYSVPFPS